MYRQIKHFLILSLAALVILGSAGCKKAVPIITGEGDSKGPPQANFYIYPAGGSASNGNNQRARALIDAKVAFATNSNAGNQQARIQILAR